MMSTIVTTRPTQATVSFVVPVYNEEDAIGPFVAAVDQHRIEDCEFEFVFVNDGSSDCTMKELLRIAEDDDRVRVIDLARNFGKEAAMSAGLGLASGDAVIVMDVDLQEPPELVPVMIERWRQGFDVVLAKRVSRISDTLLKRMSAGIFYRWFNKISALPIPEDVGDFRLMDRAVVEALNRLPERVRFMKGLFAWVGFSTATIEFERGIRSHGQSKYNYWRLWNFALDGITSFSTVPLRVWSYFGSAIAILAFLYGSVVILRTLVFGVDVPGYASLLTATLFLGGVQLIGLGVLGEYLGRVYVEVKQRPVYISKAVYGRAQAPLTNVAAKTPQQARAVDED